MSELRDKILSEYKKGNVVIETCADEGLQATNIVDLFCPVVRDLKLKIDLINLVEHEKKVN